jgi:hypothetical protein
MHSNVSSTGQQGLLLRHLNIEYGRTYRCLMSLRHAPDTSRSTCIATCALVRTGLECYVATWAFPVCTICRTGGLPPGLTVTEANSCGFEDLSICLPLFQIGYMNSILLPDEQYASCFKFIWFSVAAHHIPASQPVSECLFGTSLSQILYAGRWWELSTNIFLVRKVRSLGL